MQRLKISLTWFLILVSLSPGSFGQASRGCTHTKQILLDDLEIFAIDKPDDKLLQPEYYKLFDLTYALRDELQTTASFSVRMVSVTLEEKTYLGRQHQYMIRGFVRYTGDDYQLQLLLMPTCTQEVIAKTDVRFQLYPTWDPVSIAKQAMAQLKSEARIEAFEEKMRDEKNFGKGGDLDGGRIIMYVADKLLSKGQTTDVEMKVVDCDGVTLTQKQISTAGTIGGIFTPSAFSTNSNGVGKTKFKLTNDKAATLIATCTTKNARGCDDTYSCVELVKGSGKTPVKVEVWYLQNETHTMKAVGIPGVDIIGGETSDFTEMQHYSVLYYYPTEEELKKGLLVAAVKFKKTQGSKTEHALEIGSFYSIHSTMAATIVAGAGTPMRYQATEQGNEATYFGNASIEYPSEVNFFKGDGKNPPSFMWEVDYPTSNEGEASGGEVIVKGEDGVDWSVNKITDTKSVYKTEYLLNKKIDVAKELEQGFKTMKEVFGFDADGLAKMVNPVNPKSNVAGASGYKTISVRILSPYAD